MAFRPFSAPWADAFRAAINDDAGYRAAAARWTDPVMLVLDPPAPEYGFDAPAAVHLTLRHGHCEAAHVVDADAAEATYVLRGDYATWKAIVRGELAAMSAVVGGRLRLDGPVMALLMQADAATALVGAAQRVPTVFPDETP